MTTPVFKTDELNEMFVNVHGSRGGNARWLDDASMTATSSDTSVAVVTVEGDRIKVTPVSSGDAVVTVSADACPGDKVTTVSGQFGVTVTPAEAETLMFEHGYTQPLPAPKAEPSTSPVAEPDADTVTQ